LRGVVPAMNQMNWVKALKPAGRFQNYICLLITIIVFFFFINCFLESTLANPSRTTSDRKTQTRLLPGRLSEIWRDYSLIAFGHAGTRSIKESFGLVQNL
jgi:hypothetical protein